MCARTLRLFLCATLGLAVGCGDAARENPLDPLSDGFQDEGTVSGRVVGLYPPFPGRPDVRVRLIPVGPVGRPEMATRTGEDGQFALADVPTGRYAVVAEEDGFEGAPDTVTVAAGAVAEAMIQVNALPVVIEQGVRSVHIARWFPDEPVFQLDVDVTATDPDRPEDVDSAALVVPALGFSLDLGDGASGVFEASFDEEALPAPGIEALLGQPLRIEVHDASGNASLGPPLSLVRVIEQTPQTQSPRWPDEVSPTPTLVWQPAQLPFAFTYRADVFLVNAENVPVPVVSLDGIASSETSIEVPEALVPRDYFWTLWVVDAFGNRSRSKEAGFIVP